MSGRHYEPLGYCDKTDVSNFLLLDIDSSFDAQVDDWIATAEKQVNGFCGYTTTSGIFTERIVDEIAISHIDSEGNLMVFPRKIPIQSVESIKLIKGTSELTLDMTVGANQKYTIPTSADSIMYPAYELSIIGSSLLASFMDIKYTNFFSKITYTAGYDEVPSDIRQATVNFTADMIMRHTNKEGLQSLTQGRISKSWFNREGASDFYLDAITLLQSYKITSLWL